jgi:hypothetical protein
MPGARISTSIIASVINSAKEALGYLDIALIHVTSLSADPLRMRDYHAHKNTLNIDLLFVLNI